MAALVSSVPSYWTHKRSEHGHRYFLEDVSGKTQLIVTRIMKSWNPDLVGKGRDAVKLKHTGIKFVGVKRVENHELFHSYYMKRQEIVLIRVHCTDDKEAITDIPESLASFNRKERLAAVNEYYLLHGTDKAANIAKEGFKIREADPNNMLGKGIYFTDDFMKADQYADDKDNRKPLGTKLTVILARVVLGQTYMCGRAEADTLDRPPCIQHGKSCSCGPQERYDSVTSEGFKFREFAVYEDTRCYPEYIITYTRRGKQPRSASKDREKKLKKDKAKSDKPKSDKPKSDKPKSDKPKSDKPKRDTPKKKKEPLTLQQAVQSVANTLDGNVEVNDLVRLHSVYLKTGTALPVYTFTEDRYSQDDKWKCVCTVHFPYTNTTEGIGRRKKLAKRSAAAQMWEFLKMQ